MRAARRLARVAMALSIPALAVACHGPVAPDADFPRDPQGQRIVVDGPAAAAEPAAAAPSTAASQPAAPAEPPAASAGTPDNDAARRAEALAKLDDDPKRLIGMDQAALTDLLGQPRFVRRDEPAQMWRYRNTTCVLDLFLYVEPKDRTGPYRVRHVEARGRGQATASTRECFRALLVAKLQGGTG